MIEKDKQTRGLLRDAAETVRRSAGLANTPAHFGSGAAADTAMLDVADRIAATHGEPPPIPRAGTLYAMLIVIFFVAVVFVLTLIIAHDTSYITSLLVGEGTIFTALTGLATYLAKTHNAAVVAYDERVANWLRTEAVIRVIREMSRGGQLEAEVLAKLLDSLGSLFPPPAA